MTFLVQSPRREVEYKPIMVIGTYPDADAMRHLKPMATREMSVFEQSLHMAGLTQSEVAVYNIFPESVTISPFWKDAKNPKQRMFKPAATPWIERMERQVAELKPKVVVLLGEIPTLALLKRHDYTKIRGYPFLDDGILYLPSLHPKDMVWSNYEWRFYLSNDLQRAKGFEDGSLKIVHPKLKIIESVEELDYVLDCAAESPWPTAFDIEVSNYEVSCIGFSYEKDVAYTVPFDDRWTIEDEVLLWRVTARFLENPLVPKILQNGLFDTYFLAMKNGIITKGRIEDTMCAHSVVWPDFLKGLGFLGSTHTTYTYWKDQLKGQGFKEED